MDSREIHSVVITFCSMLNSSSMSLQKRGAASSHMSAFSMYLTIECYLLRNLAGISFELYVMIDLIDLLTSSSPRCDCDIVNSSNVH